MSTGRFHSLASKTGEALFAPIDLSPLVYFRVLFGAIMLWEVARYLSHDWIERYYIDPDFFFTYMGFGWVKPWPGNWMYVHFLALGILAVFIMLGLWYRISIILFFIGFTHVFLIDMANYLNHFYLISLISFLLIFMPAHRGGSLDALRHPEIRAKTGPSWPLWLLRAQLGIVYFYGGIAKINADWLRGEPMRMWLAKRTDFPLIGPYFTEPWAPYLFSYGGLLLDLLIVPFLLWRRTRMAAFAVGVVFHLTNARLFDIGIFPWFMIGATLLFFDPNQFRPFRRRIDKLLAVPKAGRGPIPSPSSLHKRITVSALVFYLTLQLLIPLRHWLYPGNVHWTEEGHNFSWHMKLRDKRGTLELVATDPATGETWTINQRKYLSSRQRRKMRTRPDMILLFCHHLEKELSTKSHQNVEIHTVTNISLNGRAHQLLVDPTLDLTTVRRSILPSSWIVPLENPLERQ